MPGMGVIHFSGKPINEKQVEVTFRLLPGSGAADLGCYLAVWEGNQPGLLSEALCIRKVEADTASGIVVLNDFAIGRKNYIIGLGLYMDTADDIICACLEIPSDVLIHTPLNALLSQIMVFAENIGTDFLIARIQTPPVAAANDDYRWIALFPGKFKADMRRGVNVITSKYLSVRYPSKITLKDIPNGLSRFETYTLVYGVGSDKEGYPDYDKIIGTCTFIVWRSRIYVNSSFELPLSFASLANYAIK